MTGVQSGAGATGRQPLVLLHAQEALPPHIADAIRVEARRRHPLTRVEFVADLGEFFRRNEAELPEVAALVTAAQGSQVVRLSNELAQKSRRPFTVMARQRDLILLPVAADAVVESTTDPASAGDASMSSIHQPQKSSLEDTVVMSPREKFLQSIPMRVGLSLSRKIASRSASNSVRQRIAQLERELAEARALAEHDPLTGLLNRRGFRRRLDAEMHRADRYGTPFGCVLADLDHFKKINDEFGHAAGDAALLRFANLLTATTRRSDVVGRLGGDEFCVLLPGCDMQASFEWAMNLRESLARAGDMAGVGKLTGSFGVAVYERSRDFAPDDLFAAADAALRNAKAQGRNQVRTDRPTGTSFDDPASGPMRMVRALFDALKFRDPAAAAHSVRVSNLAMRFAKAAGLHANEVWVAQNAALLHDIGKLGVPDTILYRKGKLGSAEKSAVASALVGGSDTVRAAFGDGPLAEAIRHRWTLDQPGTEDVPRRPRSPGWIVALADTHDNLVTGTPYHPPVSSQTAVAEIKRLAGNPYPPAIVEEFVAFLNAA